jgi:hypothetical protein
MTKAVSLVLRAVLLTVLLFVFFASAAVVSGVAGSPPAPAPATGTSAPQTAGNASSGAGALLFFCALVSAAFTWAIARSSRRGWPLVAAVFLAYFGLGTLLPQMESALFLGSQLPPGFVWRLASMRAIVAALFAPPSVRILGWRPSSAMPTAPPGTALRGGLLTSGPPLYYLTVARALG